MMLGAWVLLWPLQLPRWKRKGALTRAYVLWPATMLGTANHTNRTPEPLQSGWIRVGPRKTLRRQQARGFPIPTTPRSCMRDIPTR